MTFTIDQILGWKPCEDYPRKRIEGLFSGRESITAEELAELDIPIEDKIWVFLQTKHAPEIVERIVTRATNHALTCGIPEVEAWAKSWMDGTDRSEAAAAAAVWAAWAARAAVARGARVARAAAGEARAAPWAAAWARGATEAAERELQLADCLAVMRKGDPQ
jgi:hypothetical protein